MISDQEFQLIAGLMHEKFGIFFKPEKKALVLNRLQKLVSEQGFQSYADYYRHVVRDPSNQALTEMVNQLTTNYSYFDRIKSHFDFFQNTALRECLAAAEKQPDPRIHVWSAGCASGEEAYLLAMILAETSRQYQAREHAARFDFGVLATDISMKMLLKAQAGCYPAEAVKCMDPLRWSAHFTQIQPEVWQIKPELKKMVLFKYLNLMEPRFPFRGKFQAIFCCNVMIYFERKTIAALVQRFFQVTEPGGFLFTGLSEALDRTSCPYQFVAPGIYKKALQAW